MKTSSAVAITLAGLAVVAGAVVLHPRHRHRPRGPLAHARRDMAREWKQEVSAALK